MNQVNLYNLYIFQSINNGHGRKTHYYLINAIDYDTVKDEIESFSNVLDYEIVKIADNVAIADYVLRYVGKSDSPFFYHAERIK